MAAAAAAGTLFGLSVQTSESCCMFGYTMGRGWPFQWLSRGGVADDPDVARRIALTSGWSPDALTLVASLLFWACAGLLAIVAVTLLARLRKR
jgi:hypothetical protein